MSPYLVRVILLVRTLVRVGEVEVCITGENDLHLPVILHQIVHDTSYLVANDRRPMRLSASDHFELLMAVSSYLSSSEILAHLLLKPNRTGLGAALRSRRYGCLLGDLHCTQA